MAWVKCRSCGYDGNDINRVTCAHCGAKLIKPPESEQNIAPSENPTIIVKPAGQKSPPAPSVTPHVIINAKSEQTPVSPPEEKTIIVKSTPKIPESQAPPLPMGEM